MSMELFLFLFRALGWMLVASAAVELVAALLSRQVRGYMLKHPLAHFVWFACALCLAVILIPAYSRPHEGF